MNEANRRGFLKIAGVGAAAIGATALTAPAALSAADDRSAVAGEPVPTDIAATADPDIAATGSMAAYVHDAHSGEVTVMVEGREVTVTDHALVAALGRALRSAAV